MKESVGEFIVFFVWPAHAVTRPYVFQPVFICHKYVAFAAPLCIHSHTEVADPARQEQDRLVLIIYMRKLLNRYICLLRMSRYT